MDNIRELNVANAQSMSAAPSDASKAAPLAGLKVLDLTRVLAGPYCTMILSDLGADVVKIERPNSGDEARGFGPFLPSGASAYFASLNRGKSSMALDLKVDSDRETFLRLARQADVLVENFRPGVMESLGFGPDQLREINPRLVFASASGFGQTGPYRNRPAYDVIIQAMSGLMSITGHSADQPARVGASISDIVTGMFTAIGILAALRQRDQTGRGSTLDIAMLDSTVAILENAIARFDVTGKPPEPIGTRHPSITPFQSFPTRDGAIVIAAGNEGLWTKLCDVLGAPELATHPQLATNALRTEHQPLLENLVSIRTETQTTQEWLVQMSAAGIPCGPIQTLDQVVNDEQLVARGMFRQLTTAANETFLAAASPIRIDGQSPEIATRAPEIGQDANEVLSRWLGKTTNTSVER
ncbi:MAG: CoA transferase [Planctomycetota bacterium]|nr:CoA transferase [Planctomycetota bacterium]